MMTDLRYLQQMTGNDTGLIKEMIELFLQQLAEARADIELLTKSKDWLELSRLAHKIKSSALVMGIEPMVDDMKELEIFAREGKNVEKYPEYIANLNTLIDKTEVELRIYLDSGN
jgi:HPt (histidine-containing phosphotransfer) domain-containing protein